MAKLTAETISLDLLKTQAGTEVFHQGQQLFRWGRVIVESVNGETAICKVNDGRKYEVEISLTERYLYFRCDCRFASQGKLCEHDVAAALALQGVLQNNMAMKWQNRITKILNVSGTSSSKSTPHPYLLFFSLQNISNLGLLKWKITPYQLHLRNIPKEFRSKIDSFRADEIEDLAKRYPGVLAHLRTPYQTMNPAGSLNCPYESVTLANLLIESSKQSNFGPSFPLNDFLLLIQSTNSPLFLGTTLDPLQKALFVSNEPGEICLELKNEKDNLRINTCIRVKDNTFHLNAGEVQIVSYDPLLILVENYIFSIDNQTQLEILKNFAEVPYISISEKEVPEFLDKFYLPLAKKIPLLGDTVNWEVLEIDPTKRIYLKEIKGELQAQLRYAYGDHELTHDPRYPQISIIRKLDSWTLVRVVRSPIKEEEAYQALSSNIYSLKKTRNSKFPGTFELRARTQPVDFLIRAVPALTRNGYEIFGEDNIKSVKVNRNKPTLSFNIASGIDWFDLKFSVNFGDIAVSMKEFRRVMRKRERFIKLADGTIGEIPEEWIERYRHVFSVGDEVESGVRLGKSQFTVIDQLISENENVAIDEAFIQQRKQLRKYLEKGFSGITQHEIPKLFNGELRPYQKAGFNWLHFLHEFGFGGCLADDMGLGKTIQALVFLQSLYESGKPGGKASLIVVPRSLLANWQREASRFTPNLRILEFFDRNRPKDFSELDNYDLVITTYGVLLRDIEGLKDYGFYYALLDESQIIKNPHAQTTKAARMLNAKNRLVLTGTPVENSTIELWSQFAFLNPGLLGNLNYFKNEFTNPIERKNDSEAAEFLRKIVYPFILRRTKDQVAPELPPRSEKILFSDMEPAQRKLYNRTRDYYRGQLLGLIENESENGNRMKILEGLLRLRQISNHPLLVDDQFRGESGKFELLIETLDTLKSEGHKALIFSQFVQMLQILRKLLDQRKIPYSYLDGQTQDRQERVDEFQTNPNISFFLISLKAGGLGLNLTAADYVIHIDPWWNPAVEMQATDRTHRIGQEKPVFVYKLITRDSVEEKVIQLQENKRELVDQLIISDNSILKDITSEDIQILFS